MNIRTKPKFINKHAKPSVSWVKKLDEYKNLAIIAGFLSYLIGFLLWSLYLWRIRAGFVNLYDFNLIVSGLIPTSIILLFSYILNNSQNIFRKIKLFELKNKRKFEIKYQWLFIYQ